MFFHGVSVCDAFMTLVTLRVRYLSVTFLCVRLSFPRCTGRRQKSPWNILNDDTRSNQPSNTIPKSLLKSTYKTAQNCTSNMQTCKIRHELNFPFLILKRGP